MLLDMVVLNGLLKMEYTIINFGRCNLNNNLVAGAHFTNNIKDFTRAPFRVPNSFNFSFVGNTIPYRIFRIVEVWSIYVFPMWNLMEIYFNLSNLVNCSSSNFFIRIKSE